MLLGIFVLVVLIGISICPKAKLFEYVPLLFMCIAMSFSQNVPDFENYERVYNYISGGAVYIDTGVGWYYLCKIGCNVGLNYRQFTIVIYVLSFLLMNSTAKCYVHNYRNRIIIWSIYLLFPALLDAVQIRFFLAQAIVVFGFRFLSEKKIRGYIIYAVLCLLAASVHTSSVFYLVFLLGPILHKIQKYLVGMVVFATIFMIFGRNIIYQIASIFVNGLRIERYFQSVDAVGPFGFIAYTATLVLFWQIAKYCVGKKNVITNKTITLEISELYYQMSILIWMIIPLTLFDTNFFRIQRPMWLMLYVLLANMNEKRITHVKIGRFSSIKSRYLALGVSFLGFVFYICAFNINVIAAFLL